MRHDPFLECSLGPEDSERTAREATLERYVVRESALREFVLARLEQAPWWTISLLVHILVVIILWRWPMHGPAQVVRTPDPDYEVGIVDPPDRREIDERDVPKPPDDVKLPERDDFKISPKQLQPEEPEPPGDQSAPAPRPSDPAPKPTDSDLRLSIPVIAIPRPGPGVPTGPGGGGFGPRNPGDGDSKEPHVETLLPPILAGLRWLARVQEADGSWDAQKWEGSNPYRVGMTGLALLAFHGAGYTHRRGTFRTPVDRGLRWLARSQQADGRFPWETFYEQGIAAMAVTEAYGMTKDPRLRGMAQAAVNYIVKVQPAHGGFRYQGAVAKDQGDLSVTGWQIMALKSARLAGLDVPEEAIERSRAFLANSRRDYGASAYLVGSKEDGSLAISAIGMLCRIFLAERGEYNDEVMWTARFLHGKETKNLEAVPGGASGQLVADLYYTYYSSLAMYQVGGEYWRAWKATYYQNLIDVQVHQMLGAGGRPVKGSWDPAKHRWGKQGGRVYTTAMAILCLEASFRFLPTFRLRL